MDTAFFENLYKGLKVPLIVCSADSDYPVIYINHLAAAFLFPTDPAADKSGLPLADILRMPEETAVTNLIHRLLTEKHIADVPAALLIPQSGKKFITLTGNMISLNDNDCFVVYLNNAERRSDHLLSVLQTVSDNLDSQILVNTLDTYEILFVNEYLRRSLPFNPFVDPDKLIGRKCFEVMSPGRTTPCPDCPLPKFRDQNGCYIPDSKSREFYSEATGQWFVVRDNIVEWTDGQLVHLESALEITFQKKNEESLRQLASTDEMTGAFCRKWGYRLMKNMLGEKRSNIHRCMVFLDLDGLKMVNDKLGHLAGDEMIIALISIIKANLRKDDFIIRWGGDEFILLLNTGLDGSEIVMKKILSSVDAFNQASQYPYRLSFSYGVVAFDPVFEAELNELISRADLLMYKNKMNKQASQNIG